MKRSCHSNSETESYSDDSHGNVKKYKATKKENDSEDSISGECKNVTQPGESSDSSMSRADSESPVLKADTIIETGTSRWTDLDLPNFNLTFQKCNKVEDVFFKGIAHFAEKKAWSARVFKFGFRSSSEEEKQKEECFYHAILNVFNIDCTGIDDIEYAEISKIKQVIEDSSWIAEYAENSAVKKRVCIELSSSLKIFIWQLLFIIGRCNKDEFQDDLYEGMFQELFVYFARIFSLNIMCGKSVPKYQLSVNGTNFSSYPDAILCHPTDTIKEEICAIVEVKRYKQDEYSEKQVRNIRSVQKLFSSEHIGSSLKGQHGGQFLCSVPYSVFGNSGMFGFIVQGTIVTLTSFKAQDGYYDNLCKGCLHGKKAVVEYSREYNILRRDDRKHLVQTFLDIGKLLKFLKDER